MLHILKQLIGLALTQPKLQAEVSIRIFLITISDRYSGPSIL